MSNTDNFQMIVDFADGQLNPVQEDQLFLHLSSDETLKQQFKGHLAIKSAIHASNGAVTLPSSSKSEVFSKLGIAVPLSHTVQPETGGWISSAGRFIAINRKSFVTALVSIAMTAGIFLMFMPKEASNVIMKSDGSYVQSGVPNVMIPSVSSTEVKRTHKTGTINTINNQTTTADNNTEAIAVADNDKINEIESTDIKRESVKHLSMSQRSEFNEFAPQSYRPAIDAIQTSGSNDLALEIRGANYWNTLNPTISPKVLSNFNNSGISLFYKFNSNLYSGLDLRQETFFLTYSGVENGQDFNYQQQPNFTTFSAVMRYRMDDIGMGISPFAQVSAGINSAGFLGRAMAGVQYEIIPSFSVMLGVEYNGIMYKHQNNYFNNSKIGLNYGLMYMF